MSANPHDNHAHSAGHGSYGSYVTGFILAVILTVIPFWAAMTGALTGGSLVALVMILGAIQVVVHLRFFLHIDSSTDRWTWMSLIFTVTILAFIMAGSIWIMYHLNHNMMVMPME